MALKMLLSLLLRGTIENSLEKITAILNDFEQLIASDFEQITRTRRTQLRHWTNYCFIFKNLSLLAGSSSIKSKSIGGPHSIPERQR